MKFRFKPTKKRLLLMFISVVILAFIFALYVNSVEMNNMFDEALRLQNMGRYSEAVELYKQISIKYSGSSKADVATFKSAEIYQFNLQSPRLAEKELEALINRDIDDDLLFSGTLLLSKILSEDPDSLGDNLKLLKRVSTRDLENNEKLLLQTEIAEVHLKMMNYKEAAELYEKSLSLTEDTKKQIDILMRLSTAYASCFEREKAEKVYRKLLQIKTLDEKTRTRVEWLLFTNLDEQDRFSDAMDIIDRMISKNPENLSLKRERERIKEELDFVQKTTNKEWWQ